MRIDKMIIFHTLRTFPAFQERISKASSATPLGMWDNAVGDGEMIDVQGACRDYLLGIAL